MEGLNPIEKLVQEIKREGFRVLNLEQTKILFSPASAGTPEREQLLEEIDADFDNDESTLSTKNEKKATL